MALYEITKTSLVEIPSSTYAALGLLERNDIQALIRDHIDIVSPGTMLIAEEFSNWEDSRRRIDLLGLDRDRCLVVIELKRTQDGGHMELQALRYAAMVSPLTFEQAVEAYGEYLASRGRANQPEEIIRDFLEIPEGPIAFSNRVRIVLASADFSKEVTSAVLWLNQQGLDITCVRIRPYLLNDRVLMDAQQVIPLPEAEEFQVAIRTKTQQIEAAQANGKDYTRFRLWTATKEFTNLPKRRLIYQVVIEALRLGVDIASILNVVPWRRNNMFVDAKGKLSSDKLMASAPDKSPRRYFCQDDELIYIDDYTYAMSNQWGNRTEEAVENIVKLLPTGHGLRYEAMP